MEIKHSSQNYGTVAKTLHWLIAVLVIIMLTGSFFFDDIPLPQKHIFTNLHKLTGLVILFLMIFRLIWRLFHRPAALPVSIPRWQARAARAVHGLLYTLVILMALVGWVMTSAERKAPHLDGWQILFPGIPQNQALADFLWPVHQTIAWILIGLICLHTLAALKHLLINRDGVFQRMWG